MPAKRKEEGKEESHGTFRFADGSVYVGQYALRSTVATESAAAVAGSGGTSGGGGGKRSSSTHGGGGRQSPAAGGGAGLAIDTGASMLPFPAGAGAASVPADPTVANGYGTSYDVTGAVCEGQWRDGRMSGESVVLLPKGTSYVGGMLDGQYHGFGRYTWVDGTYYEGEFEAGTFHGIGVYVDAQARRWHGTFHRGQSTELTAEIDV